MQPEIELIFNYVVIFVSIEFHIENDSKKSKNSVTLEGKLIETISNEYSFSSFLLTFLHLFLKFILVDRLKVCFHFSIMKY